MCLNEIDLNFCSDDKKLTTTLKRIGVTNIPAIEEVNMFKNDGEVIHFVGPKGELNSFNSHYHRAARASGCSGRVPVWGPARQRIPSPNQIAVVTTFKCRAVFLTVHLSKLAENIFQAVCVKTRGVVPITYLREFE